MVELPEFIIIIIISSLSHYIYNGLKPLDTELCQFILLILSSNCLKHIYNILQGLFTS
jgi:hypothetical protein